MASYWSMTNRSTTGLPSRSDRCTEFQLYVGDSIVNVVDFTAWRLLRYAAMTNDPQQRLVLLTMVNDYKSGHIAVAWKNGAPVYVNVTKDS
jgi:hypothetical protein